MCIHKPFILPPIKLVILLPSHPHPLCSIHLFIGVTGVRVKVRVGEGNFLLSLCLVLI